MIGSIKMVYIPKPQNRESILIFGDGDEAVFSYVGNSVDEDYYLFHIRPTTKMMWRKQIQMSEEDGYDRFDGWWKKRYKKDLCKQISFDPDFPMWLILCDWYGNEKTPMMDYFVKCTELLERNRYLDKKVNAYKALVNRKSVEERKRAMHPDESFLEFEHKVKRLVQSGIINISTVQQQQEMETEE